MKQEEFPIWMVGVIFSMDTITYTITSFIMNFVPKEKKDFPVLVAMGTVFFFISMILSGPFPFIFADSVIIICLGILVGGIGGALVNNNCVPALNQILASEKQKYESNSLKNNLSAITTGAFGLGSILGPILASLLEAFLNYRWSFSTISLLVVLISIMQWIAACLKKKR